MHKYDAAVIGGGLAGLIAAIELADVGKTVAVLEKSTRLGGRAMTISKNGANFNLGGHALYLGGETYEILQGYGLKLTGGKPSTKGSMVWNNAVVPMPSSAMSLLSSSLLNWRGKLKLVSLLWRIGKMNTTAMAPMSLRNWAESEIDDPMVRHIFYALCRTATYTYDADHQTAGPVLKQVQRSLKTGVRYLDGGWQTIVDQLRDRALQKGVHIHQSKAVTDILHENGRVTGILMADGSLLEAQYVISTLGPADTFRLTKDAENTVMRRWKEEARPVVAASLDLALKRLPVEGRNFAVGLDQAVFFSNHSVGAKLSDEGTIVVHLTKYNGPGQSDPKGDERYLEQTMSLLHPGWEGEVVARQYLPNMTVVNDYPHLGRSNPNIGPVVPEIQGLYVAGDWVSHGELLADASAASARRAAHHIAGLKEQQKASLSPLLSAAR